MQKLPLYIFFLLSGLLLEIFSPSNAYAQTLKATTKPESPRNPVNNTQMWLAKAETKTPETSDLQPFDEAIKNTEKLEGLFTLYRNKDTGKIYLEVKPEQLDKNYLATITMESGIGERGIYSGMPLQDFLFYFRRVNNNLHFAIRNVNFRTRADDPQARSVARSFSDSVLYSLKIKSIHPQRKTLLIDLGDLLLTDVPGLSSMLSGVLETSYRLDTGKSYFGATKVFPMNMEIESVYGFSSSGEESGNPSLLPDNRALTLKIHYSLSQLPENNHYVPRLADDRVGYFTTVYEDFSQKDDKDQFVRYINRWHLEKQDPTASLSPVKKPIVFWIENTVPVEYRDAMREGVLMWNKAFETAGYQNAIEVRQMPDNATWDPADVRYNTIRWLTSADASFALGPSRVNPLTGEILDADIIVDANMLRSLKSQYRALIAPKSSEASSSNPLSSSSLCNDFPANSDQPSARVSQNQLQMKRLLSGLAQDQDLCFGIESTDQLAMGSQALALFQNVMPSSNEMKEYVHQYVRSLIAHEVGHTLGLRHNFRGSTLLKPEDLNNPEITRAQGLVSSVMDYAPVNLAPAGTKQGDYFTGVVGSYDRWAIEYGYKPSGKTFAIAEKSFLRDIAEQQATNPALTYSPDEDSFDLDPTVNRFDLSGDPMRYSQWQLENARLMWNQINKRYPVTGESYSEVSDLFDRVFGYYFKQVSFVTKYVGGQSFHRDHAGSLNRRLPFEPVPVDKQRQALAILQKYVFAEDAFQFPPELLNKLAPSRWMDWSNELAVSRLDYPVHDRIFFPQSLVLRRLLSGDRLSRLRDLELKNPPGQVLTLPELFNTLQTDLWSEVLQPSQQSGNISSFRRALQREHLEILISMVLRNRQVPEDARSLAWKDLRQLQSVLNHSLRNADQLDDYTKAHLQETRDRISKALDANLQSN